MTTSGAGDKNKWLFIVLYGYDVERFIVNGFANTYGNNPHIKAFALLIQIISFNFAELKDSGHCIHYRT
jgi:hypothetical protein